MELIRRDFLVPVLVTVVTVIASMAILDLSWPAFFPITIAALLTVAYAATLHYLALELALRPILFDINDSLDMPVRIDRPVVPLRVKLLGSLPLINVITGLVVAALTSNGGGTDALGINVLIALFVSFTISFELTVLLSRSILRPIEDLEAATERIRQGRFDEHVPVTTSDEFGELSSAFNQMVDGLAERERLREAFGTYLDEEVAAHLINEDFEPHGQEVEVSLVFCDVRDFTTAAAEADAPEVVARLNELFECIVPIVARHRGHIDQFIGDAVLAVFGAPEQVPAARRPRGPVRGGARPDDQQPQAGRLRGRHRRQHGQGRRRRDRRRRPALLQRDRRRRQPLLTRRGSDPGDGRSGADHRRYPRPALRDDRGRAARRAGDPRLRPQGRVVRAAGPDRARDRSRDRRQRSAWRSRRRWPGTDAGSG